jgi:hypothetical protein
MGANLPNRSNCGSCRTTVRRLVLKMVAVKLLGGKCHRCGWSEHIAAFEFHHRDGRQDKEFQIGGRADRAWAAVKAELEKCDLLCSNCHRIEHSRQNDPYLRLAASGYSGMLAHLLL